MIQKWKQHNQDYQNKDYGNWYAAGSAPILCPPSLTSSKKKSEYFRLNDALNIKKRIREFLNRKKTHAFFLNKNISEIICFVFIDN